MEDFFVCAHAEEKHTQFLNEFTQVYYLSFLMNFHSNLKLLYETSSCTVNFLDLNVSLRNGAMHTDLYINACFSYEERIN